MKEADGLRVLLVDDVMDALEPLQMLLTLRGCDVRSASCADAALAIEKVWRPDVVITDIGLPGMDGRQLASQLRVTGARSKSRRELIDFFAVQPPKAAH